MGCTIVYELECSYIKLDPIIYKDILYITKQNMIAASLEEYVKGDSLTPVLSNRKLVKKRKRRHPYLSRTQLKNAIILETGLDIDPSINIYSAVGRRLMTVGHVFWVQTFDNERVACCRLGGHLKELSLSMCQAIWPNVHTRSVGANQREVKKGVVVPIIPWKFYHYKKHNQAKSRESRLKKRDVPPPAEGSTPVDHGAINVAAAPSNDMVQQSLFFPPTDLFYSSTGGGVKEEPEKRRRQIIQPFRQACDMLIRAGKIESLQNGTFDLIHTSEDLQEHPYSAIILQFYHFLWTKGIIPHSSTTPEEPGVVPSSRGGGSVVPQAEPL
jgi:hypothetical protein